MRLTLIFVSRSQPENKKAHLTKCQTTAVNNKIICSASYFRQTYRLIAVFSFLVGLISDGQHNKVFA